MVDLLIGVDALGAEAHPVDVVVAGLDAEDLAARVDAQIHAALHSAEAAVCGDEGLAPRSARHRSAGMPPASRKSRVPGGAMEGSSGDGGGSSGVTCSPSSLG